MAIAKVKMPDGRIAKIKVPDGATQQDIIGFARKIQGQQGVQAESKPMAAGESVSTLTGEGVTAEQIRAGEPLPGTKRQNREILGDVAPIGGMLAGGALGGVPGAALGYAGGEALVSGIDAVTGRKEALSPKEMATKTVADIATGASLEMGGLVTGKAASLAIKGLGKAAKSILGKITGTGTAIEEAIASGKSSVGKKVIESANDFDRALRGEITGEEIVTNARNALTNLKDIRGANYTKQLEKIKLDKSTLSSVTESLETKLRSLMGRDKFDIKAIPTERGVEFDFSTSTLVEGQPLIEKALKDISTWDDITASGLDILKKRISTYAGQVKRGTPAESFLTQLKSSIDSGLKKEIPGYKEMTKGYSEATNLIKDIESGMMLRKEGMTGRIRADMTLRRLMSAMRDNQELRKDLVSALSNESADLVAQTAGYSMRSIAPLGLAGTGPALVTNTVIATMNPYFWPVVAASSPRVSGEFLRLYGRTLSKISGKSKLLGRGAAITAKETKDNTED